MAIIQDSEGYEKNTLHSMANLSDKSILEIGCGDGRLTWRYADEAKEVTAIDPDEKMIKAARANMPGRLQGRIQFLNASLEEFAEPSRYRKFDAAIFSWSL